MVRIKDLQMGAWVAAGQIQGSRKSQQDAYSYLEWDEGHHLLILADGIGGASGGKLAADVAVKEFQNAFVSCGKTNTRERLIGALRNANDALYDVKQDRADLSDMGTTLIGAAIVNHRLHWISVGDSPLWLIRRGQIIRLNEDHSIGGLLDMRARAGEISWNEAKDSDQRNLLLAAVQGSEIQHVDAPTEPHQLNPGDILIAASDGIETCSQDELVQIVTAGRPSAPDIVEAVLESVVQTDRVGQDNASLVVYRYR